ncbi:MAG: hypothetical protein V7631_2778 [Massilia sp.]|jgi:uncharacterized protein (DUF58 family)
MAQAHSTAGSIGDRLRRKSAGWRRTAARDKGELFLGQRRIYILPTGPGAGFGALLLVLLIGSINYNLGLGFALTFLALSCALVDMLFTWRNLAHLRLKPVRAQAVFAGQEASFELQLVNTTTRARYAIWIDVAGTREAHHAADVPPLGSATVRLAVPTEGRGWLEAPRVTLSTRFPLGLFRAWSYWRPDLRALVYPFPEEGAPPLPQAAGSGHLDGTGHAGEDDFAGVRPYRAGDPLRRLAWRQIARLDPQDGGQLATKHFEGGARDELSLDLSALPPHLDLELRLSRLARWVLDAEGRALPYAFRAGEEACPAASGAAHAAACLRALALYGGGAR